MALKSENAQLKEQAHLLKSMREEAGFTQAELASRLSVSREKISAIENYHVGTIDTLEQRLLERWWSVCRSKAHNTTKELFILFLKRAFKIT